MAGLYIHIPFCRKACIYCNFHFTIQHRGMPEMVSAIAKEMELRSDFFETLPLDTFYFGGGTPSVIPAGDLKMLIEKAATLFGIKKDAEITLEANPEDVHQENLEKWKEAGINRLSIGIQSLQNDELKIMNRNHDAIQAMDSVALALKSGIHSINIDLIFGSPWVNDQQWQESLDWAFSCGADHISAYGLTVEPATLLAKKVKKHELPDVDENRQAKQYGMLYDAAEKQDWDFYEISNLSKAGHRARHNSNYWKNLPYLGLGPSAHSFGKGIRSWNPRDNRKYVGLIENNEPAFESEILSEKDLYNEFVMTRLRMVEGFSMDEISKFSASENVPVYEVIERWRENDFLMPGGDRVRLNLKGRLICDTLTTELMA